MEYKAYTSGEYIGYVNLDARQVSIDSLLREEIAYQLAVFFRTDPEINMDIDGTIEITGTVKIKGTKETIVLKPFNGLAR